MLVLLLCNPESAGLFLNFSSYTTHVSSTKRTVNNIQWYINFINGSSAMIATRGILYKAEIMLLA